MWVGCAAPTGSSPPTVVGDRSTPAPLADVDSWVPAEGLDPLASHRPSTVPDCGPASVGREGLGIEIDTGACPYVWLEQPLRADLRVGDPVSVLAFHAELVSEVPAEGHMALLVGDAVLWERTVPIPSEPCVYPSVVASPIGAAPGARLSLHLHNHGANTWNLLGVQREAQGTPIEAAPDCQ